VGEQARKVLADAQAMLKKIIEGRWLQANGVMGLFPANRVGDDIVFYTDESRSQVLTTWYGMRQQTEKQAVDGVMRPSRCLADFVATRTAALPTTPACSPSPPASAPRRRTRNSKPRWTTTAASCSRPWPTAWPKPLPNACTSACARTCGAMPKTRLSNEQLIKEQYQGIRPAPGYPACPDHTAKIDLFKVLQAEEIGMT
jgi:5-methyltetrahydrofolate--homocysteine methyltransferase